MRILFHVTWIPYPPESGARIRTWEIARRLARRHEVTFALHRRWAGDEEAIEEIERQGFRVRSGKVNRGWTAGLEVLRTSRAGEAPVTGLRRSAELDDALRNELEAGAFDVVQVEHAELAAFPFRLKCHERTVLAITLHDLLSVAYARMAEIEPSHLGRVWRKINAAGFRVVENRYLPKYDLCAVVSEKDRESLKWVDGSARSNTRVETLPNGVDTRTKALLQKVADGPPHLLFVGQLNYSPNTDAVRWLLRDIFPLIRRSFPQARLTIVGAHAPKELMGHRQEGVSFPGGVTDLTPYYQSAHIAVAPLRAGGGTRLKILEAMALGRPVVSTSLGAEGLGVEHGKHLLIADSAEEIAAAVGRLMMNPLLREELRTAARQLVESHYDWDQCADRYHALYGELNEQKRRAARG